MNGGVKSEALRMSAEIRRNAADGGYSPTEANSVEEGPHTYGRFVPPEPMRIPCMNIEHNHHGSMETLARQAKAGIEAIRDDGGEAATVPAHRSAYGELGVLIYDENGSPLPKRRELPETSRDGERHYVYLTEMSGEDYSFAAVWDFLAEEADIRPHDPFKENTTIGGVAQIIG